MATHRSGGRQSESVPHSASAAQASTHARWNAAVGTNGEQGASQWRRTHAACSVAISSHSAVAGELGSVGLGCAVAQALAASARAASPASLARCSLSRHPIVRAIAARAAKRAIGLV